MDIWGGLLEQHQTAKFSRTRRNESPLSRELALIKEVLNSSPRKIQPTVFSLPGSSPPLLTPRAGKALAGSARGRPGVHRASTPRAGPRLAPEREGQEDVSQGEGRPGSGRDYNSRHAPRAARKAIGRARPPLANGTAGSDLTGRPGANGSGEEAGASPRLTLRSLGRAALAEGLCDRTGLGRAGPGGAGRAEPAGSAALPESGSTGVPGARGPGRGRGLNPQRRGSSSIMAAAGVGVWP